LAAEHAGERDVHVFPKEVGIGHIRLECHELGGQLVLEKSLEEENVAWGVVLETVGVQV
jgi:hypothetical protein